ncbi:hypothetical protein SEVIR_6G143800v4 [Setaria viridis]|uniref:Uncharacterized protein n=2 Tax=Setaria TaxID=4554 RepID=A0A368RMZ5_SETIT|nr:hypothetical protein SETIT_6G138800v2 [Setaria italica]TKW10154.1 hypothetical protein SEVIR_6G143800v2 [Setaria viridis]
MAVESYLTLWPLPAWIRPGAAATVRSCRPGGGGAVHPAVPAGDSIPNPHPTLTRSFIKKTLRRLDGPPDSRTQCGEGNRPSTAHRQIAWPTEGFFTFLFFVLFLFFLFICNTFSPGFFTFQLPSRWRITNRATHRTLVTPGLFNSVFFSRNNIFGTNKMAHPRNGTLMEEE